MTREQALAIIDALDEYERKKEAARALTVCDGTVIHEEAALRVAEARQAIVAAMHPIWTRLSS